MAIVLDGLVTPDALTAFIREVPTPADQVLNRLLPDRTFDEMEIRYDTLSLTNRAAKFRAFDARIPMAKRDAPTSKSVRLPPLSIRSMTGELERLQLEQARQSGTASQPMIDAIYNDATILTKMIRARMELARGDVLTDGKFTLASESGLIGLEADFGVPGGNLVTTGTAWATVATATVIQDLITWRTAYITLNGFPPAGMVLSTTTLNYMLRNAEVRTLSGNPGAAPALVRGDVLTATLSAYGLPPILFVYDTVVDVDGTSTRAIAADKVIFVPPGYESGSLGYTAWGTTATALELVGSAGVDFSFADAPGIVGVVEKSGPPYRQEVFVDAIGMPIIVNPNYLMVADVAP